ncbi:hypothetical protein I4U23_009005 [Adineta vaga]|nr:hypothetical protein I4U23_009005 [Adineta vaga]
MAATPSIFSSTISSLMSSATTLTPSSSVPSTSIHSDTSTLQSSSITITSTQIGSSSIPLTSTSISSTNTQTIATSVSSFSSQMSNNDQTTTSIQSSNPTITTTVSSQPTTVVSTASTIISSLSSIIRSSLSTTITTITTQSTTLSNTTSSTVITTASISQTVASIFTSISSINMTSITVPLTTTTTSTSIQLYIISTVFKVFRTQKFDSTNSSYVNNLIQGLSNVIRVGFQCLNNQSDSQCSLSSRRKRQACLDYTVIIIGNVTLISSLTANPQLYMVNYTASDSCNRTQLTASQVRVATARVPSEQIPFLLGYDIDGDFVRDTGDGSSTSPSSTDRKLWIIGAVLGPIVFALLLIGLGCCLYLKCRPRTYDQNNVQTVYNAPRAPGRTQDYQSIPLETRKEQPTPTNNIHLLPQNDLLIGNSVPPHRLPPIELQKTSNNPLQQPVSIEIPMQEIRHQNDVDRWRNKLRLQEKFEQRYADPLTDLDRLHHSSLSNRIIPPITNHSTAHQSETRPFENDPSNAYIRPRNDMSMRDPPIIVRRIAQASEIEAGRNQLHRLLDEVLDKVEPNQTYNPDSTNERRKRRRQQRRVHSTMYDSRNPPIINDNHQSHHMPIIPQVSERPNPTLLRLHYNPYEAGDRAHDIERYTPVELKPKYASDDVNIRQRYPQSSHRSNPPLFYDDSVSINRAMDSPDVYGIPNSQVSIPQRGQRHHKFHENEVYVDTIPKTRDDSRVPIQNTWTHGEGPNQHLFQLNPSDLTNDPSKRNDFRDEYIIAKQSVVNTKNLISSIHDELQHIVAEPSTDNYHA